MNSVLLPENLVNRLAQHPGGLLQGGLLFGPHLDLDVLNGSLPTDDGGDGDRRDTSDVVA